MMKKAFALIALISIAFLSGCIFDRTTSETTSSTTTSTTVFPTTTATSDTASTTILTGSPTLTSDASINYVVGTDIILSFTLYDGEFVSLSGNGIEAADYQLVGSQVTIVSEYVDSVFTNNPDQDVIVLSYKLSYSGGAVVGYLYIHNAS